MNTVTWTDDRIDELATKVDGGFARMDDKFADMDARFAHIDVEFAHTNGHIEKLEAVSDERFKAVDQRLERIEVGFAQMNDKLDAKFDALQRTLLQVFGGLIGTTIAAAVALILAHGV